MLKKIALQSLIAASLLLPLTASAEKPQGLPAEVAKVIEITHQDRVSAVGRLDANETILLRPEQSGRISSISFTEGAPVKAGDKLFTLNDEVYRAEVQQAEARVQLSRIEYKRADQLLKRKVGSQNDRDAALAQLRVDQAQLELTKARLDKMTIKAPFSGLTGLRMVSPGDFVNDGQDLVELTDISTMKADFKVPEIYLSRLAVGQPVEVTVSAFANKTFSGELYAIAPSAEASSHSIQLRARIDNTEGLLRPGLFASINLETGADKTVLSIPEEAVIPKDNHSFVMRMGEGNKVEMVQIRTGKRSKGSIIVNSGLNKGDVIVTAGHLKLRPGMPITPIFAANGQEN